MANVKCMLEIYERKAQKMGESVRWSNKGIFSPLGLGGNHGTCLWGKLKLRSSSAELWVAGADGDKQRNCFLLFGFCCVWGNGLVTNSGKAAPLQLSCSKTSPQCIASNATFKAQDHRKKHLAPNWKGKLPVHNRSDASWIGSTVYTLWSWYRWVQKILCVTLKTGRTQNHKHQKSGSFVDAHPHVCAMSRAA